MTCKKCGSALSPNANFCHHCGEVQEKQPAWQQPATQPSAAGGRASEAESWAAAEGASGSSAQPLREPQPGNASTTSYPAPQYNPYYNPYNPYNPYSRVNPNDAPHIGYAILSFFFPIVGLILYLVWKDEFPQRAKSAGKGALVGVITGVALSILFVIIWFGLVFWILESAWYY